MIKLWSDEAWEDYIYWQAQDKITTKKDCHRQSFYYSPAYIYRLAPKGLRIMRMKNRYIFIGQPAHSISSKCGILPVCQSSELPVIPNPNMVEFVV